LKDNRLLPAGFDKETVPDDVAVAGQAGADQDFVGGEDRVRYEIEVGEAEAPLILTVDLLYQSIGYRWIENLAQYDGPEIARFLSYSRAVPNVPLHVGRATVTVN
jgi:hypothetical protein